jgi:hypothetical protein
VKTEREREKDTSNWNINFSVRTDLPLLDDTLKWFVEGEKIDVMMRMISVLNQHLGCLPFVIIKLCFGHEMMNSFDKMVDEWLGIPVI